MKDSCPVSCSMNLMIARYIRNLLHMANHFCVMTSFGFGMVMARMCLLHIIKGHT
uniref:Uncharacterized protein n=1 Tax=Anguilla anguilla TaxID=7936 RepID=A0A0E9SE40_ANGAN